MLVLQWRDIRHLVLLWTIISHTVVANIWLVDPETQFRGNNLQSKILYYYAKKVGESYLSSTIKSVVEKIVKSSDSFEVQYAYVTVMITV
jgi:hypothetical protein